MEHSKLSIQSLQNMCQRFRIRKCHIKVISQIVQAQFQLLIHVHNFEQSKFLLGMSCSDSLGLQKSWVATLNWSPSPK